MNWLRTLLSFNDQSGQSQGKADCRLRFIYNFSLFTVVCFSFGCSTGRLLVESDPPGAEIVVQTPGQSTRNLGKAPMELPELSANANDAVQVTAQLSGYHQQSTIVPGAAVSQRGQIFFKLTKMDAAPSCQLQEDTILKVAKGVAEAQQLIASKEYDRAIALLSGFVAEFPSVSLFYDLLGNAFYLRRDTERAYAQYRRSLELSPGNIETSRMVQKIEAMRGGAE